MSLRVWWDLLVGVGGNQHGDESRTAASAVEGKVALVTGGTRGIGSGTVGMVAAEGTAVAFTEPRHRGEPTT